MSPRVRETEGEVLTATRAMYAAYGDRPAFDAHLHPDVTIWETDQPGGLIGLAELDALRDGRAASPEAASPEAGTPEAASPEAGTPEAASPEAALPEAASSEAARPTLSVLEAVVDRWGETAAVIRYLLRAEVGGTVTEFRVTDVLVRGDSAGSVASAPRWRIVHHHAESLAAAPDSSPPEAAAPQGRG